MCDRLSKWLVVDTQAVKRLLTFCQRAFPTDPSRSVDFDAFRDAGRGAAGEGSDKKARNMAFPSRIVDPCCAVQVLKCLPRPIS